MWPMIAQQWFAFLKKGGCKRLKIYYQHSKDNALNKDFEMAGFCRWGRRLDN